MRKRGKPIFRALVVALAMLFACCTAQERLDAVPGEQGQVRLRIRIDDARVARGQDGAFPGGGNTIMDGTLYFYKEGDSRVLRLRNLSAAEIASINAGERLLILSVPSASTRFFMVANSSASGVTLNVPGTIATVRNTVFGIASQMTAGTAHSAEKVILAGTSDAFVRNDQTGQYETEITLAPLVARLEIGPLQAVPIAAGADTPGDIKGFTVSAIYLNRFHLRSDLNPAHTDPVDNGEAAASYSPANPHYATSRLYDNTPTVTAVGGIAALPADKVWAYQFFPSEMPHIVIQLDKITYSNGQGGTTETSLRNGATRTQYLTVQSYSFATGGEVTGAERARIYKIDRLEFNADHLGDYPYHVRRLIRATLRIADWDEETINPEYD